MHNLKGDEIKYIVKKHLELVKFRACPTIKTPKTYW